MNFTKDDFNVLTNLLSPGDDPLPYDFGPGQCIWVPNGTYGGHLNIESYDHKANLGVARSWHTGYGWAFKVREDLGKLWPKTAQRAMLRVECYEIETVVTHGAIAAELGKKLRTYFFVGADAIGQ